MDGRLILEVLQHVHLTVATDVHKRLLHLPPSRDALVCAFSDMQNIPHVLVIQRVQGVAWCELHQILTDTIWLLLDRLAMPVEELEKHRPTMH